MIIAPQYPISPWNMTSFQAIVFEETQEPAFFSVCLHLRIVLLHKVEARTPSLHNRNTHYGNCSHIHLSTRVSLNCTKNPKYIFTPIRPVPRHQHCSHNRIDTPMSTVNQHANRHPLPFVSSLTRTPPKLPLSFRCTCTTGIHFFFLGRFLLLPVLVRGVILSTFSLFSPSPPAAAVPIHLAMVS